MSEGEKKIVGMQRTTRDATAVIKLRKWDIRERDRDALSASTKKKSALTRSSADKCVLSIEGELV